MFTKTVVVTAMVGILGAMGTANAAMLPVSQLSIGGGTLTYLGTGGGSGQPPLALTPGPAQPIITGIYQGAPNASQNLTNTLFFGVPFYGFTAPTAQGASGGPFPPPTGMVDTSAGTINMDMSSWFGWWGGDNFNLGFPAATGTYNPVTGAYTLNWTGTIVGGPFNAAVFAWTLTGTASVVPLPAAVWLFGSGLMGLIVLGHRRRA